MSARSGPRGRTILLTAAITLAGIAVIGAMIGLAWLVTGA
jgi:hypothetical protein